MCYFLSIFILVTYLFKDKIYVILRGEELDCHRSTDIQNSGCSVIDDYKD